MTYCLPWIWCLLILILYTSELNFYLAPIHVSHHRGQLAALLDSCGPVRKGRVLPPCFKRYS